MSARAAAVAAALAWGALVASPAEAQRAPDVPATYAAASLAHVHFDAAIGGLVLSRASGTEWEPLGVAPMDLSLPFGPISLALAYEGHAPVPIPIAIEVRDGDTWLARYDSRQGLRELGVGLLLTTAVLTLVGIAVGIGGVLGHDDDTAAAGFVAGAVIAVVGTTSGVTLATAQDLPTLEVH